MKAKAIKLPQYKYIVITLTAISFISLVLYVFAVNKTVRNIVERQRMEAELNTLSAKNSELEFSYIDKKNALNFEKAKDLGFHETGAVAFVSRQPAVAIAGTINSAR